MMGDNQIKDNNEEKNYYDIVFIVLVYRNTSDLTDFFQNLNVENSKVIVVNSYYDEETKVEFETIARRFGADFINVENKGYGCGNNAGCKHAIEHYNFKYIIISNADIMIESLDKKVLESYSNEIVAPKIVNLKGKNQNPGGPYKPTRLEELMKYYAYKHQWSHFIFFFYILARLKKISFNLFNFRNKRQVIYSAHGAFVILTKLAFDELYPLYYEKMFLFNEEGFLARKALSKGVKTIFDERIQVKHKEDGSISMLEEKNFNLMRDSYMYYYEYFNGIKK